MTSVIPAGVIPLGFYPSALARNCHLQTLMATLGAMRSTAVPSRPHHVKLNDGDALCCEETLSPHWKPHHPTAILVHGLGGSHQSQYMVRMAHKLIQTPCRVVRVNMRGCGSGVKLCSKPYHGGLSDDIWETIRYFHKQAPGSPTILLGYSLGGNVILKLAGEKNDVLSRYIRAVIAVSPPFRLDKSLHKLSTQRWSFYERYFVSQLRRQYILWARHRPDLAIPKLPNKLTIATFDDIHTVPRWQFASREDYYHRSSCAPWVEKISVPCHIICSTDDPVVDTETVFGLKLPPCVQVWQSAYGGHMGFVNTPWDRSGVRWLDQVVLRFIAQMTSEKQPSFNAN